eukprot:CAMPEP_0113558912 /NCGR_PEP_ID=MMETSP0015_2-20120614/18610_1 /TAXON_ID=2838 /ORGANISM="Odontella" /LENGTH=82 /DNA_ID=CAMNT_0000460501 /DNA_START=160 /DNA_END=408 /DNA_ORIENTATION=+ /assembly_acc=CAM_ASM_000160
MSLRQIISKALFHTLEKDLSRSVAKEVAAMDHSFCLLASPRAFSYRRAACANGAFGSTVRREAPAKFVRVDQPIATKGLFHE